MYRPVIDQLLRKELMLHNPLVNDYLTKGAAYNRGFCRLPQRHRRLFYLDGLPAHAHLL